MLRETVTTIDSFGIIIPAPLGELIYLHELFFIVVADKASLHRTWLRCKNSARLCPLSIPLSRIIADFCLHRCCSQLHHQSSPQITPYLFSHPYRTLTVTAMQLDFPLVLAKTGQT